MNLTQLNIFTLDSTFYLFHQLQIGEHKSGRPTSVLRNVELEPAIYTFIVQGKSPLSNLSRLSNIVRVVKNMDEDKQHEGDPLARTWRTLTNHRVASPNAQLTP